MKLIHNAAEVVTVATHDRIETHEQAAVLVEDGTVEAVGPSDELTRSYPPETVDVAIDAGGKTVVPGFVDPHTHAVFAGDRSNEFEAKLAGKTYQEIRDDGGGILRTVRSTREASTDQLVDLLLEQLDVMLAHGTTTAEVKSGYGLETETELRMLKAIEIADDEHPIDLVATFLGAHDVPPESNTESYVDDVVESQIPAVADQGIAEFCDVFCETGVFDIEQSRRVLEAGRDHGLMPKVHADELSHLGGTQLAADVGAASADHLLYSTEDDAEALSEADVSPVLLPGTAFSLGVEYADAQQFLDAGAPVAVATDLNPNCYSQSMGFAVSLACIGMGMTPARALGAATSNAARAIGRDDGPGEITPGSPADIAILDAPSHAHVPYNFGVNNVETVLKDGVIVHD
ncbi:imidazolonepropionase [Halostagnicola sp. A-GB9-2]|uniref:imidazolonepropionase n=1 Tax=Halostagnicola sp. A-GB9-2 TaxID=3048066 RepID=UPI0024BF799B|nr:imidazolonepropionase [Halostagnicola sp. A-GB9-2]MDJ1434213.1 imidazolonepropionase [Halostagnicola sp. A-GB9-2]